MWGSIILLIAVTSLALFFGLKTGDEEGEHNKELHKRIEEPSAMGNANEIGDNQSMETKIEVCLHVNILRLS